MMIFDKIIKAENEIKSKVIESFSKNSNLLVTYFNQNCYNHYISHSNYGELIDKRFTVYIDGIGIYLALKYLGYKSVEKFNASDLNYSLFELFAKENKRIFLIGGDFLEKRIFKKAKTDCINIVGYSPGFFENSDFENLVKSIRSTTPQVVIIGMGVPKQEILAAELSKSIIVDEIICVGNFLEFYFGTKPRIPKLLRNLGIEWLFRLISEPKRLWKRYLLGIPRFIVNIFRLKKVM
jgi:N-acetylglucosaminyldiphosphoundecaprenol N-acetyl-beta-D-mannosaminyltransferase